MERSVLIRLVEELLEHRLPPEERARAARHILRCRACRRQLTAYRRIRERMAAARGYESQ